MKKIIIALGAGAAEECTWVRVEEGGRLLRGEGTLAEAAEQAAAGYRPLLLVPGDEVLLTRVNLPPGNRKQLAAAVPYALEESLAAEVEEQHFALGESDEVGALAVAVIARERLQQWLDICRSNGLEPMGLIPEMLALPRPQGGVVILLRGGTALVRSGPQDGFVLESADLELLPELPGFKSAAGVLLYHDQAPFSLPPAVAELVSERRPVADPLLLLAEGLREGEVINLLQGEYSPQAPWERQWRRWRLPAVLLLLLLLIQAGIGWRENRRLEAYDYQLSSAIEEVYRQAFPGSSRIVNPKVQMEQQLQSLLGGGADSAASHNFLALLGAGGPLLAAGENMKLGGLRYRLGELDLELEIADLQALDRLKEQLTAVGLAVEIRTATTRGDQVQARLQLKEAQP